MSLLCNQVEILKSKLEFDGVEDMISLILKKIKKNSKINKSLVNDFE